ncbi:anthrone oxygenase family protein [Streptomyces sp. NPDC001985]|uniref:anthrone oxygenase family protein n=1 Tax=Streptomyces sp. NPDC001985 TaxID=3154406 RepID=UPI00331EB708
MIELLGTAALLGSGIVAGVFFAVAVSVLPTVQTLPAPQYVQLHRRLGEGYHPVMPLVVTGAVTADLALLLLAPGTASRTLFAVALLGLVGVQLVSQFGNVPINRRVHALDPGAIPADWDDPRTPWRNWHRLRTGCAVAALTANALAVALLP